MTSSAHRGRAALVVRGDRSDAGRLASGESRFAPLFEAFASVQLDAIACMFSEGQVGEVRDELLDVDLALVWVDPVSGAADRGVLDAVLRDVARNGVVVSAHPDVIERMGTKEVLYATRELGWGGDIDLYRTADEFRRRFPARLTASNDPRVLKQYRGNGGIGVWKVEPISHAGGGLWVRVQGARHRDHTTRDMLLDDFIDQCLDYFAYNGAAGRLVDQPFQPRITDGIIRCYFVKREVVGFCRQYPAGTPDTTHPPGALPADLTPPANTFGLPAAKTMFPPDEPTFSHLKTLLEATWVPEMQRIVGVDDDALPFLWDADFLFGPRSAEGHDTYVLCEINVSAVTPFPPTVPAKLAAAAQHAISQLRR